MKKMRINIRTKPNVDFELKRLGLTTFFLFGLLSFPVAANSQPNEKFMTPAEIKERILNPQKFVQEESVKRSKEIEQVPSIEALLGKKNVDRLKIKKMEMQSSQKLNMLVDEQAVQDQRGADLRYRDTSIKDQSVFNYNGYGTCTAFGLASLMENMANTPGVADMSERHIWDHYRVANMVSAIEATMKSYSTEEAYWPDTSKNPKTGYLDHAHTKIRTAVLIEDDMNKMMAYLDRGKPVYLGFSTPSDAYKCKAVVTSTANTGGGHAVAIVGYQLDAAVPGSGYFIIKNSWGPDCGDKGYFYIPFKFCQTSSNYCWMYGVDEIDTAYVPDDGSVPTPTPVPTVTPEPGTFDPEKVSVSFDITKKWYSSYRTVYLYITAPVEEMDQIASVTYTLANSTLGPKTISDSSTDFEWSFSTQKRAYDITYTIKLRDGQEFVLNRSISY